MIAPEWYAPKAEAGLFTSRAAGTAAALRHLCGFFVSADQEIFAVFAGLDSAHRATAASFWPRGPPTGSDSGEEALSGGGVGSVVGHCGAHSGAAEPSAYDRRAP
jgi:hypothetical protein